MSGELYITENDKARLMKLIEEYFYNGKKMTKSIEHLESELNKARVVSPKQLPRNVISMNTRALLDLDGDEEEVSLVYPDEADLSCNKLSVFSPVGTAILGYKEGDIIEWPIPSGTAEIRIKKVLYQPEAAGDYDL